MTIDEDGSRLPTVFIGVVAGAGFLLIAADTLTRKLIGVIILVFVSWNLLSTRELKKTRAAHDARVVEATSEPAAGSEQVVGLSSERVPESVATSEPVQETMPDLTPGAAPEAASASGAGRLKLGVRNPCRIHDGGRERRRPRCIS